MKSLILLLTFVVMLAFASAQCGGNPTSGLTTISTAGQVVNTYFPGLANPTAGQSSLTIDVASARGSATTLASGDLVLIIQNQGAALNTSNSDAYGDGVAGGDASGALTTGLHAGYYEYNTVNAVSGSTVTFSYTLANNYYTQAFSTTTPLRNYQVIRVPRYYDLTINAGASVTTVPWDGRTGGMAVLDAVNVLTVNGNIDVSAMGFRGGGGKQFVGVTTNNTSSTSSIVSLANTDYRFYSAFSTAANSTGGAKGEGIAGTPVYFNANGTAGIGTEEGYVDGSIGRGAPGNAGGGSTDGDPSLNGYNTGGGGGANGGNGGRGGSGWHGGAGSATTYPFGGFGGSAFSARALQRLVMGGGGGAGSANNSTSTTEIQSSGGSGGGIIIARAKSYAGNGSFLANGGDAPGINGTPTSNTDAAGGGGAGGTLVVVTREAGTVGLDNIGASAIGGMGGNGTNHFDHGPGGGGGGGMIYTNGNFLSTSVTGGVNGKTRVTSPGGAITNDFGATSGADGQLLTLGYVPVLINHNDIASPCGVLPVTLTSFNGVMQAGGVSLSWEIADAVDLDHFEVEFSKDGRTFNKVTDKTFDASIKGYQLLHAYTSTSMLYYRLKMVDKDGSYNYSKVITVKTREKQESLLLYPSPAVSTVTLQIKAEAPGNAAVLLLDMNGKIAHKMQLVLRSGDNAVVIAVGHITSGFYIVKLVKKDGTTFTEKLQILTK